jgi:hypothetical protein
MGNRKACDLMLQQEPDTCPPLEVEGILPIRSLREKVMIAARTIVLGSCVVLLALAGCNREPAKSPDDQPKQVDAATLDAYEKLGAKPGVWQIPTKRDEFWWHYSPYSDGYKSARTGRYDGRDSMPGFRFDLIPESALPDVSIPFGLSIGRHSGQGLKAIAGLKNLAILEFAVHADDNELTGKVTDADLKELTGLANLQMLFLTSAYDVTDAGMKEVARVTSLTTLFAPSKLTDAGLATLAPLTKLKMLYAAGNALELDTGLTDKGTSELVHFKDLTFLDLRRQRITSASLANIKELKKLNYLNLFATQVSAHDLLRAELVLPELRNLYINWVDLDTQAKLGKLFPNAKIMFDVGPQW